jgi:hypothetical protein
MPITVTAGQSVTIAVSGDGFISGMTTFDIPSPSFRRTSNFSYAGNYVYATFAVAPDAPPDSVTVFVTSGNQSAALTGAVRVVAASSRGRAAQH